MRRGADDNEKLTTMTMTDPAWDPAAAGTTVKPQTGRGPRAAHTTPPRRGGPAVGGRGSAARAQRHLGGAALAQGSGVRADARPRRARGRPRSDPSTVR